MTQRPHCPDCGSTYIQPDSTNGGAGRNVCMGCGHRAPVREFYAEPDAKLARSSAYGSMRPNYFYDPSLAEKITKTARRNLEEIYMQQTEPLPEGIEMDPITGNLRRSRRHSDAETDKPHFWWQDQ